MAPMVRVLLAMAVFVVMANVEAASMVEALEAATSAGDAEEALGVVSAHLLHHTRSRLPRELQVLSLTSGSRYN